MQSLVQTTVSSQNPSGAPPLSRLPLWRCLVGRSCGWPRAPSRSATTRAGSTPYRRKARQASPGRPRGGRRGESSGRWRTSAPSSPESSPRSTTTRWALQSSAERLLDGLCRRKKREKKKKEQPQKLRKQGSGWLSPILPEQLHLGSPRAPPFWSRASTPSTGASSGTSSRSCGGTRS